MKGRRPTRDEAGLSLIELIATLGIMGVAFLVIIGGMFTAVVGSDLHRKQANSETVLRSFAEAVKQAPYEPCASAEDYNDGVPPIGYNPPEGYAAAVSGVDYWDSTDWTDACAPPPDPGLQRLTLEVTTTDGRSQETVEVVKRGP